MLALQYYESGNFAQAERTCDEILRTDARHARGLQLLGIIHGQRGDHAIAAEYFEKAIAADPNVADFYRNSGHALRSLGRLDEAVARYRAALRLKPDSAESKLGLANALTEQDELDSAIEAYEALLRDHPTSAGAHYGLATALQRQERIDDAVGHYEEALRLQPNFPEALNNLAGLIAGQVNHQAAAQRLRQLIRLHPDFAPGHCNLGLVLTELGEFDRAIAALERAVALNPHAVDAYRGLANACIRSGRLEEAATHFERLSDIESDSTYRSLGEAAILERKGKIQEAHDLLAPLVEAGNEGEDFLVLLAVVENQLGRVAEAAERLEAVYDTSSRNRVRISFELGHIYDKLGDYDSAMEWFQRGNELKAGPFDETALENLVASRIEVFASQRIGHFPRAETDSRLPVFIVGMPRSGTSLVEQILSNHPEVYGAGELMDVIHMRQRLPKELGTDDPYPLCMDAMSLGALNAISKRHLQRLSELGGTAARVTDKMPFNFFELGFISLLFPSATVIHCVRNPVDTCLSCYFQNFPASSTWSFDLRTIGQFYNQYQRMMRHWADDVRLPILDVQYEDLVRDPEIHVRRILDHVGLQWNDRCLRFHESDRVVSTASYKQVRQPIYTRSVARWRNYRKFLSPLLDELGIPQETVGPSERGL